eukprot:gnl/TRDRNA2_/TRDRNA2_161231_c0_seq3.p1 gnl/TRDRNA2_/TRDRNA2_161231_c0~~gnl/TRDRNA2_/TRDRNA2_161231_c0_seq3.p1  ORF type:complete len:248 (+),score=33.94 gnl/TRDRNA2_/TRDRNA2_161231_c0_seq3:95-745(+)
MEGIELDIVESSSGCLVPVVCLDKSSTFHENASWMLQSASASGGKADSLYEYDNDRQIIDTCKRNVAGLSEQDISLVHFRENALQDIKAVGTSGKRSVMLSCVVALVLNNRCDNGLYKDLKSYGIERDFSALMSEAERLAGRGKGDWGNSYGSSSKSGKWDDKWSGDWSDNSGWSGKRKWTDDSQGWWGSGSSKKGKSNEKAKAQDLDQQLEDYWK